MSMAAKIQARFSMRHLSVLSGQNATGDETVSAPKNRRYAATTTTNVSHAATIRPISARV